MTEGYFDNVYFGVLAYCAGRGDVSEAEVQYECGLSYDTVGRCFARMHAEKCVKKGEGERYSVMYGGDFHAPYTVLERMKELVATLDEECRIELAERLGVSNLNPRERYMRKRLPIAELATEKLKAIYLLNETGDKVALALTDDERAAAIEILAIAGNADRRGKFARDFKEYPSIGDAFDAMTDAEKEWDPDETDNTEEDDTDLFDDAESEGDLFGAEEWNCEANEEENAGGTVLVDEETSESDAGAPDTAGEASDASDASCVEEVSATPKDGAANESAGKEGVFRALAHKIRDEVFAAEQKIGTVAELRFFKHYMLLRSTVRETVENGMLDKEKLKEAVLSGDQDDGFVEEFSDKVSAIITGYMNDFNYRKPGYRRFIEIYILYSSLYINLNSEFLWQFSEEAKSANECAQDENETLISRIRELTANAASETGTEMFETYPPLDGKEALKRFGSHIYNRIFRYTVANVIAESVTALIEKYRKEGNGGGT